MRNKEPEQIPLLNLERNPLVLLVSLAVTVGIDYLEYNLLKVMNPWGFIVMVPAVVLTIQTLWLLLNPFAVVFKDKIEIKQTFFHHKDCYFIDIKRIDKNKKGRIFITYHDDEIERLWLFGIKSSHLDVFKAEVEKLIVRVD